MPEIENYSLFCEDIRWESNGSPMIFGVMSPVFNPSEYPVTFEKMVFASFFRAPIDRESFSATLSIFKLSDNAREEIGEFGAEYRRDESGFEGHQWVAISHLPLPAIEFKEGDSLVAEVQCEGERKSVYLSAGKRLPA